MCASSWFWYGQVILSSFKLEIPWLTQCPCYMLLKYVKTFFGMLAIAKLYFARSSMRDSPPTPVLLFIALDGWQNVKIPAAGEISPECYSVFSLLEGFLKVKPGIWLSSANNQMVLLYRDLYKDTLICLWYHGRYHNESYECVILVLRINPCAIRTFDEKTGWVPETLPSW